MSNKKTFDMLLTSFKENFKEYDDISEFQSAFDEIANKISEMNLDIEDVFIDVSRKKRFIDFNLNLVDKLFLSVAVDISNTKFIRFAIAKNHETIAIDECSANDAFEIISESLKILNNIKNKVSSSIG